MHGEILRCLSCAYRREPLSHNAIMTIYNSMYVLTRRLHHAITARRIHGHASQSARLCFHPTTPPAPPPVALLKLCCKSFPPPSSRIATGTTSRHISALPVSGYTHGAAGGNAQGYQGPAFMSHSLVLSSGVLLHRLNTAR
jgi:hypothetical protein